MASMKFTFLETSTRREKLFLFLKFGRESVVNCWAESFAAAAEPETSSRALAVWTLELYRQLDLADAVVERGRERQF